MKNTYSRHSRQSQGRSSFRSRAPQKNTRGRRRIQKSFDVSRYINKNPAPLQEEGIYVAKHSFKDFNLADTLSSAIEKAGLTSPTPIQDQIIPHIQEGRDVIGLANTGTGKTAAFLIPLINKAIREQTREVLILTPTRELAIQIEEEVRKLRGDNKIYSTVCVGGAGIGQQIRNLKRRNHFIIGTPGRVLDLIKQGYLKPQYISAVVLDEADRMLDMGFIGDMRKILAYIPKERETLFFSATMSTEIEKLVHDFLRDPVTISVKKADIIGSIKQDILRYTPDTKFETLVNLLKTEGHDRVLIFGAMKHSVEKLSKQLTATGIKATSIHGNKSHPQRQRSLQQFKSGEMQVLVATDVAARGIHVDNVTHVINYDLPNTYEDYVHRIGRTGRGANKGGAITFVT